MRLPDTQNASELYAFKKGYRLAIDGKTVNQAPSNVRYDQNMRQYCLMGWEQAQEEMAAGIEASQKKPWRNRLAWFVVTVLGSIATATLLINNINEQKAEQQALISNKTAIPTPQPIQATETTQSIKTEPTTQATQPVQTETSNRQTTNLALDNSLDSLTPKVDKIDTAEVETNEPHPKQDVEMDLGLLTPQQRNDLTLTQEEQKNAKPEIVMPTPIISDGTIEIETAVLTSNILNREPTDLLGTKVPKNIRKLFFFTQIKGAKDRVIYHRWLHNQQVMALIPLTINSNLYRTWSSKRLTSAWQGQWTVEVLDTDKQVLYRHSFTYGS